MHLYPNKPVNSSKNALFPYDLTVNPTMSNVLPIQTRNRL